MADVAADSWRFDEAASTGTSVASVDDVARYDEQVSFDPSGELEVLLGLGLSPDDTLIDFGPGPGRLLLAASPHARRVVGVDPSPAMCAYIERRATEFGLGNVEVVQAGFLSYRHEGEPVAFMATKNAMHHLPDFWKQIALVRMRAALRRGGILRLRDIAYSFEPADTDARIDNWINDVGDPAGWSSEILAAHVRDEYSTYGWILEAMLERAGFRIEDVSYSDSQIYAAYTCAAA